MCNITRFSVAKPSGLAESNFLGVEGSLNPCSWPGACQVRALDEVDCIALDVILFANSSRSAQHLAALQASPSKAASHKYTWVDSLRICHVCVYCKSQCLN